MNELRKDKVPTVGNFKTAERDPVPSAGHPIEGSDSPDKQTLGKAPTRGTSEKASKKRRRPQAAREL